MQGDRQSTDTDPIGLSSLLEKSRLEHNLARVRRRVQVLRQRPKRHLLVFERSHDAEQEPQRTAEPVKLPHDKCVARPDEFERPR